MNQRRSYTGIFAVAAIIVVVIVAILAVEVATHVEHTTTATICSKERVATNSGGEYRIYTSKGTFVIKDSHWPTTWRTNSSEVYGRLKAPGTYKITYIGIRFSLLSMFKNILSYKQAPPDRAALASC